MTGPHTGMSIGMLLLRDRVGFISFIFTFYNLWDCVGSGACLSADGDTKEAKLGRCEVRAKVLVVC